MDICRRQFGAGLLGALAGRAWAAPNKPKLTVLVIVEELRSDALDFAWPQLSPGGFRRLSEKGAWFPSCHHLSSTFSSCGIANLATGSWPAQHGIIADTWYNRTTRGPVRASDEYLLATTLAAQPVGESWLRTAVVAMNRPHAGIFAGTSRANLFFLDQAGRFTSSGAPPDWLREFNTAHSAESFRNANWMAVNAASDAPPLRVLDYDESKPQDFLTLYKSSPFGQLAEFDLASELIVREKMGQGNTLDLLCVIDGSAALLGYAVGAQSALMNQMVLQLDRRLESLWNVLVRALGENNFNLVVCAAHGAPVEPAGDRRARMAVNGETIAQAVEAALKESGRHVEKYIYPFLYLDKGGAVTEALRRVAAEGALGHPAVAGYYTGGGVCSMNNEWQKRFQNSFHAKRSGDVMLSYRPEYVEDYFAGRGISYGSLYNYDSRVPLFLYGPQFRPGVNDSPVEAVDLAPTLARAMGIAEPSSALGRVLGEALIS